MSLELHICNRVIRGGSVQELQLMAAELGGQYEIYQVFKSKMWEIPPEKSMKLSCSFTLMTDKQIEEAAEMFKKGKRLKEIAPKYKVSVSYVSKAIHSILGY